MRVRKFIKSDLFRNEFVHFFITIGFIAISKYIVEKSSSFNVDKWFAFIMTFLVFLGIYIVMRWSDIASDRAERKKIEERIRKSKEELEKVKPVSAEFIANDDAEEDRAYEASLLAVTEAKNRILIISDSSTTYDPLEPTMTRQIYYETIEEKLEKIAMQEKEITYIRWMQRQRTIWDDHFVMSQGRIDKNEMIIEDEQAYAHCKRVLKLKQKYRRIDLRLYVTPSVPSMPSILIIDSHTMLFTIPKKKNRPDDEEKDPIETAGALHFNDNTRDGSAIITPFLKIFDTLYFRGNDLREIKLIGDFPENKKFHRWYEGYKKEGEYLETKKKIEGIPQKRENKL